MVKSLREIVLEGQIPAHIAIIMDGNGRWAKSKLLPRLAGHKEGINSVREITRICGEIGVKHLTLYTFSTENWNRPKKEVGALMKLLLKTINIEIKELHNNNVRFTTIGNIKQLPGQTRKEIINDKNLDILLMNPGAIGTHGYHKVKTMIIFYVNKKKIEDLIFVLH